MRRFGGAPRKRPRRQVAALPSVRVAFRFTECGLERKRPDISLASIRKPTHPLRTATKGVNLSQYQQHGSALPYFVLEPPKSTHYEPTANFSPDAKEAEQHLVYETQSYILALAEKQLDLEPKQLQQQEAET